MTDMADFLAARLEERQAAAQAAAAEFLGSGIDHGEPVHWRVSDGDVYLDGGYGRVIACGPYGGGMAGPVAEHIARYDPATVLAGIAAERAILDQYRAAAAAAATETDTEKGWIADGILDALAGVVRTLLAAHAGHPDYDSDWRMP